MKSLRIVLVLTQLCLSGLPAACSMNLGTIADNDTTANGYAVADTKPGDYSPRVNGKYVPLDAAYLKPDSWGIYTWRSTADINAQSTPDVVGISKNVTWSKVEPEQQKFDFEKTIGRELRKVHENDFYITLKITVAGPSNNFTPQWLYNECNVPRVLTRRTENPYGYEEGNLTYPHYVDNKYIEKFYTLIEAFGNYIDALPDDLHQRILFIQIAEGSTGDGQPYKGDPIEGYEQYEITSTQWSQFRMATWQKFKRHFVDLPARKVPLLVNADSNRNEENQWLINNMPYFGIKEGMFSHGWHISGGTERRKNSRKLTRNVELAGKQTFTRGEMDEEMFIYGWSTNHIPRALYTSAQYALHNGLDLWNIPTDALVVPENRPAFQFFNKYAGHRNPRLAPAAFCALRMGLDASNTKRFPEDRYGKAKRDNMDRYLAIAERFSAYGAIQGDPPRATGIGMQNRKRKDYNDVGWGIIQGNYFRFLTQITPEATSRGWWHQGPKNSIYSQFGRSFRIKNNQGAMYFKLHSHFLTTDSQPVSLKIRVVYLDRGTGKWSFHYSSPANKKSAFSVENANTGKWKEYTYQIADFAAGGKLENRADFILKYTGGDNTIFHMIEINR